MFVVWDKLKICKFLFLKYMNEIKRYFEKRIKNLKYEYKEEKIILVWEIKLIIKEINLVINLYRIGIE